MLRSACSFDNPETFGIKMTMKMKCKTLGCDKEVEYKRDPIPVDPMVVLPQEPQEHTIVYLTCPDGHTNRYEITKTK
jgi:hypothetical protein